MNDTPEKQLQDGNCFVSTTVGSSMRPMLRNRKDRVIITPVGDRVLKKYDLPLYKRPDGKYVLHRILSVEDGYYRIRGDHTFAVEKVPFEWVLGYVTEFYRGNRHVQSDSRWYRCYATLWNGIYPIRWVFHKIHWFCAGVIRHLFLKKKK